jgi:hypothetical protein
VKFYEIMSPVSNYRDYHRLLDVEVKKNSL